MKYVVQEDAHVYTEPSPVPLLMVDTPAWYAWIEEIGQFTFQSRYGTFSARKERLANGRGGSYWRAYRKKQGRLYRVYLGKSEQLTMTRLTTVARELAHRLEQGKTRNIDPARSPKESSTGSASPAAHKTGGQTSEQVTRQLLRTKLHIPAFQAHLVARTRLVRRLNEGLKYRLILLSAAGVGVKTPWVGDWENPAAAVVAWVAVYKEHNDPVRFWSYVIAALQQASLNTVEYIQESLRSQAFSSLQPVLHDLLNTLDEEARKIVIILDDYHLIEAQAIHASLLFFLDHLPDHVHLMLASRYGPPFSVAQLRAKRQLFELHSVDLSFTLPEATTFFAQTEHLSLEIDELQMLLERTEGWIAGMQLAALSLHSVENIRQFISTFTGSHRFILSYLINDVLEHQPEHVQHFLFSTSVLERFTAPLCDALTGEQTGKTLLAHLEQQNLFLFPLDNAGRWYRYHHLLTEALSSRLHEEQPERFYTLHRLASAWYAQQNLLEEAIRHALAATNFTRAADLLEQLADTMLKQNEFAGVARWQELLPDVLIAERPWLRLAWIRVCIASGRLDQAEESLRNLERSGLERINADASKAFHGRIAALYAHLYGTRGDAQASLVRAAQALELLPENEPEWRMSVRAAMGGAYLHAGKLAEAEQTLREVLIYHLQKDEPYSVLTTLHPLGMTQILLGRPDLANATYLQGMQIAERYNLTRSAVMGHIHAGRGNLLYEWNDLDSAQEHLVTGIELARRGENSIQALDCMLTLSDVRQAQGRFQEALSLLQQALELARQTNDPFFLDFVARRPVVLWLAAQDVEAAAGCARATGLYNYREVDDISSLPPTFFLPIELLSLVHLYLAQGNLPGAKRLLVQLQAPLMSAPNKRRHIQWLIFHALTLYAEQHLMEAIAELARALELAEPFGYIRTFIDTGQVISLLLKTLYHLKPLANYSHTYVRQLLVASGEQVLEDIHTGGASTVLLGERELVVLRYLAEGYSDREIARHLILAENTIKTHTKHIYSKLQVHSRTQALARARELGLLI